MPAAAHINRLSAMPMLNQPAIIDSESRKNSVKEPRQAVAGEEDGGDEAGALVQAEIPDADLQDEEQQQAFRRRFEELAGITRQLSRRTSAAIGLPDRGVAEHHSQGRVRDFSPQFAVDEIGDAPEEQADGRGCGDQIADAQDVQLAVAAEQDQRHHTPISPPWNDMPSSRGTQPSQSAISSSGLCRKASADRCRPAPSTSCRRKCCRKGRSPAARPR